MQGKTVNDLADRMFTRQNTLFHFSRMKMDQKLIPAQPAQPEPEPMIPPKNDQVKNLLMKETKIDDLPSKPGEYSFQK